MSILIKGAKMPKSCIFCPCLDKDLQICEVLKRDIDIFEDKLPDCPLVDIPPHGKLIDKDALMENIEETYCTPCPHDGDYDYCKACSIDDAMDAIEDAPTVIESEE